MSGEKRVQMDEDTSPRQAKVAKTAEDDRAQEPKGKVSSGGKRKPDSDQIFATTFAMIPDPPTGDEKEHKLKQFIHHHSGAYRHSFKIIQQEHHKAVLTVYEAQRHIYHQYQIPSRFVEHAILCDATMVLKLTHVPLTTVGILMTTPHQKHTKIFYIPHKGMVPMCEITKGVAVHSRTLVLKFLNKEAQRVFSAFTRWLRKPPVNITAGEKQPAAMDGVDYTAIRELVNDIESAETKYRATRGPNPHGQHKKAEDGLEGVSVGEHGTDKGHSEVHGSEGPSQEAPSTEAMSQE